MSSSVHVSDIRHGKIFTKGLSMGYKNSSELAITIEGADFFEEKALNLFLEKITAPHVQAQAIIVARRTVPKHSQTIWFTVIGNNDNDQILLAAIEQFKAFIDTPWMIVRASNDDSWR